jgi:endoglucanase
MRKVALLGFALVAHAGAACNGSSETPTASGGSSAVGGDGQGGNPTGGVSATGGRPTATGGKPTGGTATGGTATGGKSTGGAATGGVTTGGSITGGKATGGTAAGALPALHVSGKAIYDSSNNQVILRGAATIDVACPYNWSGISDPVQQIRTSIDLVTATGWKTHVVRLPVYGSGSTRAGQPNNFPENGPTSAQDTWFDSFLKPAVDYATSKKLYAIVDWHEIASASARDNATKAFWTYMAPKLKNQANILYEVFNEDSDTNQWSDWRPFAQGWVDIIRGAGASNVVLVGGPQWAQTIGGSATSPIAGGNIAYVAHVYCSHYNNASSKTGAAAAAWATWLAINDTAGYVTWMKNFGSTYGASWTAWVISPSWGPSMFNADRTPTAFGQSVEDWLAQY